MTNAEKFKKIFGCYATEMWAKSEKEFLEWINSESLELEQEPVKHGKWEVCDIRDYAQRPTGRKILRCPFCGYLTDEFRSMEGYYKRLTHFCPNCGAMMEGGDRANVH